MDKLLSCLRNTENTTGNYWLQTTACPWHVLWAVMCDIFFRKMAQQKDWTRSWEPSVQVEHCHQWELWPCSSHSCFPTSGLSSPKINRKKILTILTVGDPMEHITLKQCFLPIVFSSSLCPPFLNFYLDFNFKSNLKRVLLKESMRFPIWDSALYRQKRYKADIGSFYYYCVFIKLT